MPAGSSTIRWFVPALLGVAVAAHADYKDDYAHGVRAYEEGDLSAAQKWLQDALSAHAEPAARMRLYGQVFKPYIPQHYLGLIALKHGDCATMRAQWGSSDNRQIMLQLPDVGAEEEKAGAACGAAVAKTEAPPPAPAEKPAETAPPKTVAVVAKPVTLPPPAPPKSAPPSEKPVAEKPAAPDKSGPPESLVQAFDQYLAGRYGEAARINPDAYADAHARFHAYLVRAAAKYTQARLAADDSLLAAARADAAAARALDARTAPDATLFSPTFREFYSSAK